MSKLRVHSKLGLVAFASRTASSSRRERGRALRPLSAGVARGRRVSGPESSSAIPVEPSVGRLRRCVDAGLQRRSRCLRRSRIVLGVLAPVRRPPFILAPIAVEEGATARTTPLLGEERFERRDRVDLASARVAGEPGHALVTSSSGPDTRRVSAVVIP